jgi:hypothetical protein
VQPRGADSNFAGAHTRIRYTVRTAFVAMSLHLVHDVYKSLVRAVATAIPSAAAPLRQVQVWLQLEAVEEVLDLPACEVAQAVDDHNFPSVEQLFASDAKLQTMQQQVRASSTLEYLEPLQNAIAAGATPVHCWSLLRVEHVIALWHWFSNSTVQLTCDRGICDLLT